DGRRTRRHVLRSGDPGSGSVRGGSHRWHPGFDVRSAVDTVMTRGRFQKTDRESGEGRTNFGGRYTEGLDWRAWSRPRPRDLQRLDENHTVSYPRRGAEERAAGPGVPRIRVS